MNRQEITIISWEYITLIAWREVQFNRDDVKYSLLSPDADEPRNLEVPGVDGSNFVDLLNNLGSQGWELVGPPEEVKVAMTYKNERDHFMNYADWARKTYIFKRGRP